jgi:hypothetical protein
MVTKMTKHLPLLVWLLLTEAPSILAQESADVSPPAQFTDIDVVPLSSKLSSFDADSIQSFALSAKPEAPSPSSAPTPESAGWEDVRGSMELTLGYIFVRFNSTPFSASMSGVNASFTYFTSNWLAAEGETSAAFGSQSSSSFLAKYIFYGGGVKVAAPEKRIRPWAHALLGGIHLLPQTAFSTNGVAIELGGGADLRLKSGLLLRVKADYLRSQVYAGGQNSFQLATGIVYRF